MEREYRKIYELADDPGAERPVIRCVEGGRAYCEDPRVTRHLVIRYVEGSRAYCEAWNRGERWRFTTRIVNGRIQYGDLWFAV